MSLLHNCIFGGMWSPTHAQVLGEQIFESIGKPVEYILIILVKRAKGLKIKGKNGRE